MGRGRPLSNRPLRTAELRVFVTDEQKKAAKALARKALMPLSTYLQIHIVRMLGEAAQNQLTHESKPALMRAPVHEQMEA
jgi:hypothetical protein